MTRGPGDIYGEEFFGATMHGSHAGAQEILGRLNQLAKFESIVDVGCGVGAWLQVAQGMGAVRVLGIDGAHVPSDSLQIPTGSFMAHDLEQSLTLSHRFDVALCLEVAEHLSRERGPSLVEDLVGLSDIVLFSAAIPYQGGDGHLNEMWPTYWADLFTDYGYMPWDGLRANIWHLQHVPWWYRQNLLLFVATSSWDTILGARAPTERSQLTRVHPECYLYAARRAAAPFSTSYDADVAVYAASEAGRSTPPGYGPEFPAPLIYGRSR